MPKLSFPVQAAAQARADAMHNWLVANDPAYASSVSAGKTLRWAIPTQVRARDGTILDANWGVFVKQRCRGGMSPQEILDSGLP